MQVSYVGKLSWMLQCAKGIDYLHSKNTIHRDLKTQNLLLFNKHRVLKICNFDTVKKFSMKNTEGTGTFSYKAPEVYDDSEKYSEKSDVFSFGIIVWEVMSRLKPFYEFNSAFHTTIQMEINKGVRPNVKDMRSYNNFEHIIFIIKQCWSQDPDQRPTIKALIFFLSFDPRSFRYNPDLLLTGRPLRDICDEDFRF
ncbi:mitogen-activated protein kinase kinase kinase 7-like isoform X1 [Drosophila albomicans]|uniref:Mitogen-activated protein kinase kinase kinase 7-like isoform X1 n=2 Tax=Drosophila albomicans TaxID=7291 RepID=A0A9C6SY80_DROAB|nr:mitogen-activated protein kinase kinase kinase 7-like isoform X1 [Drosophila albomicans]